MLSFFRSFLSRRKKPPVVGPSIPGYAIKTLKGQIPNPGTQCVSQTPLAVAPNISAKVIRSRQLPKLVLACMGDAEAAKRLVLHEMARQPGISIDGAVSAAIQRLELDRLR